MEIDTTSSDDEMYITFTNQVYERNQNVFKFAK